MAAYQCITCGQIEDQTSFEPCCEHEDLVCINDMPREIRESRILINDLLRELDDKIDQRARWNIYSFVEGVVTFVAGGIVGFWLK